MSAAPSLGTQIRDAAYDRLVKALGAQFKFTRKTPILPLQGDQLPQLGVFLVGETFSPDGDADVGPPRYKVDAQLSISVVVSAAAPDAADGQCDYLVDQVLTTLLTDGSFVALTDGTGAPLMESIGAIRRTMNFPKDGDAYYLEGRLQITCSYRCFFEPVAPNALEHVDITVQPFQPVLTNQSASLDIELPGS